ncbi:MAG: hypothetical protein WAM60_07135, partial [Candidatus Promineifilaceae bacterium]
IEGAPSVDTIVAEPPVTETEGGTGTAEPGATITSTEQTVSPTTVPPVSNATIDELARSANDHFLAAEAAQRNGDWATYGNELDALQQDLQQLMVLTSENGN